jgi:hypothetical protein
LLFLQRQQITHLLPQTMAILDQTMVNGAMEGMAIQRTSRRTGLGGGHIRMQEEILESEYSKNKSDSLRLQRLDENPHRYLRQSGKQRRHEH